MSAPVALSPSIPFDYVVRGNTEDPKDVQVVFECKTLTGRARLRIQRILCADMPLDLKALEEWEPKGAEMIGVAEQSIIEGLLGWRNFRDDKGDQVDFPADGRRALELLDENTVQDLGTEIWTRSKVSPEKKEPSGSQPSSPSDAGSASASAKPAEKERTPSSVS